MISATLVALVSFFVQLIVEYGTLTKGRSLATHVVVRLVSLLVFGLGAWLLNRLGLSLDLAFHLVGVTFFFSCAILFKESLTQKFFLFFASWGIIAFVSAFCRWFGPSLARGELSQQLRSLLYLAAWGLLVPFYLKRWSVRIREMLFLFTKGKPVYTAFPLLTLVIFTLLFGPIGQLVTWTDFDLMMMFEAFILLTYYLMFWHFNVIYEHMKTEAKINGSDRQLVLQKKYYQEVDKRIRTQQRLLHDNRHHWVAAASLVHAGDLGTIKQYAQALLESYDQSLMRRFCQNEVANAVIGGYIKIAEEEGIAVSAEIDLPQGIGIDEYDLSTLFGNTLENAIEACRRIPQASGLFADRSIKIHAWREGNRLLVHIENSCLDAVLREGEDLGSSKGALGGIGLESVKAVLSLYQGSLSCKRIGDLFIFEAMLVPQA